MIFLARFAYTCIFVIFTINTKYALPMKYIKTAILIAGMAAATAACTRKPVVPEFSMLSIDTLIGTPANGCKIEFRFATIANAAKSPALRSIEAANAEYFFELEDFGGTARQAVDSAIRQIAAEMLPDSVEQTMGTYEISAEAEVTVTDSLVTYIISRWSFTGGAHGMYGMECHTYSLAGGDELSSADLFPNSSCTAWKPCCARNCTNNTEPTATKSWPLRDSSRNTSPLRRISRLRPKGSRSITTLMISDAMHWGPSK